MHIYILIFNTVWMIWNIFLAAVGVAIAWFIYKARSRRTKLILLPAWLAFVPNTIYIITDIIHIPWQFELVGAGPRVLLFLQYLIFIPLGVITFYFSLRFFEKGMRSFYRRLSIAQVVSIEALIIVLNFLIAFGVAMGRFQRTNSWELITNMSQVVSDVMATASSIHQILFIVIFGTAANLLYFSFRRKYAKGYILRSRRKDFQ